MAQVRETPRNTDGDTADPHITAPAISARILKKRETDRKCQRMIRERTKSRITYLEGLVEEFREQDGSGRLETMMKQLADMKDERDALAKKVKTIETVITGGNMRRGRASQDSSFIKAPSESDDDDPPSITSRRTLQPSPSPLDDDEPVSVPHNVSTYALHNEQFAAYLESSPCTTWPASSIQSPHHHACECSTRPAVAGPVNALNRWRYANDTLSEWFKWPPQALEMHNYYAYNDDVPVRAVVQGWDAVQQHGHMHPVWRLLRGIDEMIFSSLDVRERLATLQLMGWLLFAHVNPTREQHMKLPSFYLKRPSRDMLHAYATEYFAWPGLRERFVYSEHRYCSSIFWRLYCQNIRLQWPYEFRDCYTFNIDTGLYKISPTFHERISDIRAWTMGMDMFKQYPELYSDIPAWNHIPASLDSMSPFQGRGRRALPPSSRVSEMTDKDSTVSRRGSHAQRSQHPQSRRPSTTAPTIVPPPPSFGNYPSANSNLNNISTHTISSAFEHIPSTVITTEPDPQSVPSLAGWSFNSNLNMYHPNIN